MAGNTQLLKLEKRYEITGTRKEQAAPNELISVECLDPQSTPQSVQSAVFRLKKEDFDALGMPSTTQKCVITIQMVTP
jgi:hypothetical protein